MNGSLDWLLPDAPRQASCAWTDAKAWALTLGVIVIVFLAGPLMSLAWPLRVIAITIGCLAAVYCVRVIRARVTCPIRRR